MSRPTFRTYVELPISVRHAWDGYPIVDAALEALEQGQFQEAALLADAVYTDDRTSGCLQTRINGLFGLPKEFKYPGQADAKEDAEPRIIPARMQARPYYQVRERANTGAALELKQEITELARLNWEKMFP